MDLLVHPDREVAPTRARDPGRRRGTRWAAAIAALALTAGGCDTGGDGADDDAVIEVPEGDEGIDQDVEEDPAVPDADRETGPDVDGTDPDDVVEPGEEDAPEDPLIDEDEE